MILNYEPFSDYIPPTWDELFMRFVFEVATKSKDPRTKNGAVVVRDNRPILWGFNGLPKRVQDRPERMQRVIKNKWMTHAEVNCTYQAADMGISARDGTMFTGGIPCSHCAMGVIQSGIKEVVVHAPWMEYELEFAKNKLTRESWYADLELAQEMLSEANIHIRKFTGILGIAGYLDGFKIQI
jgi:dCMP deaminase